MKNLLILTVLFALALTVSAQTKNAKIEKEIVDFRTEIRQAVKAKDRKSLERFFADGFTHTHASGKVDGKTERIDFFIKGEPTIEDVEPDEIRVIVFNKNLASVVAKTIFVSENGKTAVQWTGVYFKEKGKWKVLTTHATGLRN